MARLNVRATSPYSTYEGAPASNPLRRLVCSCMLWEDEFYVDGKSIADAITQEAAKTPVRELGRLAVDVRSNMHLRHVPLILLCALVKRAHELPVTERHTISTFIANTIQRPDEIAEFVALYWKDGKRPLSAQMKKGLAKAFLKFSASAISKHNRDAAIKLRDVLFMVRPKPTTLEQAAAFRQLASNTLGVPDTWEVNLSKGADKATTFTRLLKEGKLGYLALLRNLRNMEQAGVDRALVNKALRARENGANRVLPFRYVAAVRAAPGFSQALDEGFISAAQQLPLLSGSTVVLVDVSASMDSPLSSKSDMTRLDAAAALAAMINGDDIRVVTFSRTHVDVPYTRGLGMIERIRSSQPRANTYMGAAVRYVNKMGADRLIVITDEQSHDPVPQPVPKKSYIINVASTQHGIGFGRWTTIHGFSEHVLHWIIEHEGQQT